MILHIKTIHGVVLEIEIDANKTVHDLKKKLSAHPEVGLPVERLELIHTGRSLLNAESLIGIDAKDLIVVIAQSSVELGKIANMSEPAHALPLIFALDTQTEENYEPFIEGEVSDTDLSPRTSAFIRERELAVERITALGHTETDVRHALTASHNNAERAIQYLQEGNPTTPPLLSESIYMGAEGEVLELVEYMRINNDFQNVRRTLLLNPELVEQAMQQVATAHPSIMNIMQENQQEILGLLISESNAVNVEKSGAENQNARDNNSH